MRRDQLFSAAILLVLATIVSIGVANLPPTLFERTKSSVSLTPPPPIDEPGSVTGERIRYSVDRVVDGDTIVVHGLLDSVRLIGIDTPELTDKRSLMKCFADRATNRLNELVANKEVILERDVEDRDRYHRFLRYVYLPDETFVNIAMAKEGYAKQLTIPPNVRHAAEVFLAVQEAQQQQKGLWGKEQCKGL